MKGLVDFPQSYSFRAQSRWLYRGGIQFLSLVLLLPADCLKAQAACVVPPPGLVSWWRAEGNLLDQTGSNSGDAPYGIAYEPGKIGQAFSFDGGWSRLSVPDNQSLKLTHSLTIEGWVFVKGTAGFILFRGDDRPGLDPYVLNLADNGDLNFHVESLSAYADVRAPIARSEWKHVAATLEDSTGDMKLYVDGVLTAQTNTTVRPFADLEPLANPALGIGNHGSTFHLFPFSGLIDEIALYARALTEQEIQQIFQAGAAGKCPSPSSGGVPQISSFTPTQTQDGSLVTVTGTNFSSVPAENLVYFGPVRGAVVTASPTTLTVSVPAGATYGPLAVTVKGLTAVSRQLFLPLFAGSGADLDASSFAPRFDLPTGNGPIHVVAADLDTDGKPDLVVANAYSHVITLYQNLTPPGAPVSAASISAPIVLPAGGGTDNPYRLAVSDVDGDGKPDILVPDRHAKVLYAFRNQCGPGSITADSFAPPVLFPVAADVRDTAVADLDGDGLPEIVMASYGAAAVSILPHGPPGALSMNSFGPPFQLPAQPGTYAVAINDLDGDGKPDVAAVNSESASLSLFRNLGTQTKVGPDSFAPRMDIQAGSGAITVGVADLDGDGKNDLVVCSYLAEIVSLYRNQAVPGVLDANSFAPRVNLPANGWAHAAGFADLNGDGKPDLAAVTELPSHFSVFQNRSTNGTLSAEAIGPRLDFPTGWNAWGLAAGDLDADGRPDVVFGNAYDASISVYRNVANFAGAPVIHTQPVSQVANAGATVTFTVSAGGTAPLSYQWQRNDADLPEALSDTLILTNVQPAQAGSYSVRVSNSVGTAISSKAVLTVVIPTTRLALPIVKDVLPDTLVRLPVLLSALGTENAVAFSLAWPTSQLAFVDFVPNTALAGASVFVNTNASHNGKAGILIGLAADATFMAGTQEVASLLLHARGTPNDQRQGTPITFTDTPVLRQVSSVAGEALRAEFAHGMVYIVPNGFEADVAPRPRGDRLVSATDWVVLGRYAAHLDSPTNSAEFQRADSAPRETLGDGELSVADWVQAGRYAVALDRPTPAGGPAQPATLPGSPSGRPPIAYGPSLRTLLVSQTVAAPGQVGTVFVALESEGDENALGFSIAFDPDVLQFVGASPGAAAAAATLNVNAAEATAGCLGFALALPAGSRFATGPAELVKVSFRALPNAPAAFSELTLTGAPVKQETCNSDARPLPTIYLAGGVRVEVRPPLHVQRSEDYLLLSWPAWASNFVVQASGTATAESASWTNVTALPVLREGELSFGVPLPGTNMFYRLQILPSSPR